MSAFLLRSAAFPDGGQIPGRHTCEGVDVSPPLQWLEPPPGTEELALLVLDPDAPAGTFAHWVAWGLAPAAGGLAEGERAPAEGRNDFGELGYRGPCPPRGRGPHRYVFRLFALDGPPALRPGPDRAELERAVEGRVLAVAELVGLYER